MTYIIMLVVFAAGVIVGMLLIALSAGASCDDAYHAGYRDGVRRAAETKAELFELFGGEGLGVHGVAPGVKGIRRRAG